MGRFTPFVDTVSLLVLMVVFVFTFFPLTNDTAPSELTWAIVIFGAVVVFALVYYALYARKVYKGPVTRVRVAQ